ncbi:uncharacterized protein si:ch211-214p13.9 [Trichomycterus rosablanca]|uniref:uncharacterized protein si:ch211-214p13.9 n=1 Tax=Trichomycterus rosablanca TaxID=2290929 RepID=UPI002F35801D
MFADDTTVVGLVTGEDETAYRDEVQTLSKWSPTGKHDTVASDAHKTKETKDKLYGVRNESVEIDTNVSLHCTNRTVPWEKMIYVIWKIYSHGKEKCRIAVSQTDPDHDTCSDGKKLIRSTDGAYHLIIPRFSIHDEGTYGCDLSYESSGYIETIHVSAWARPEVHGWLELERSRTVAVCEATSRPASSIKWKTPLNFSSSSTEITETAEGLFTVTSKINLPANVPYSNIICDASTSNPKFNQFHFNFMVREPADSLGWPFILLGVCATCLMVAFLTILYIMRKKLKLLMVFRKTCSKPPISGSNEVKNPQLSDPEQVEPYASYVQRVNSIYNSSAELFNA